MTTTNDSNPSYPFNKDRAGAEVRAPLESLVEKARRFAKENGPFLTDEPLIAEENGDVLYFDSAQFASEYIEAIDVRNGEYRFYDTNGERVVPRVSENPQAIRFERAGVPAQGELAAILKRYCEVLRLSPVSESLENLIEAAKPMALVSVQSPRREGARQ